MSRTNSFFLLLLALPLGSVPALADQLAPLPTSLAHSQLLGEMTGSSMPWDPQVLTSAAANAVPAS